MSEEGTQLATVEAAETSQSPVLTMKNNLAFGDDFTSEGENFALLMPDAKGENLKEVPITGDYADDSDEAGGEEFKKKPKKPKPDEDIEVYGGEDDYEELGGDEDEKPQPAKTAKAKADAGAEAEPERPAVKQKSAVQKRIDELTFEKRTLERRLRDAEAKTSAPAADKPAKAADDSGEPLLVDFESTAEWREAVKEFNESRGTPKPVPSDTGKAAPNPKTEPNNEALDTAIDNIMNDVDALGKYNDFQDVVTKAPYFPPVLAHICADLENPGEAAYLLAKNQDFTKSLAELSPAKQVVAVQKFVEAGGRTEDAAAKSAGKTGAKKISTAPKPIVPVKGTAADAEDIDDFSVSDFTQAIRGRGGIDLW